jgi:nitroimidazol reductase NimA-like FMN-containing flavoprotein (pyridoxamine 5'-phosphate oxidase superfamily)
MLGELNQAEIEELLQNEVVGRIGCHAGRPYVVPITYAYRESWVYGHSAEGLKLRMMRRNPKVCFQVDRMQDLGNWQSVVAWGTFDELVGDEAEAGLQILLARLRPLATGETSTLATEPPAAPGVIGNVQPHWVPKPTGDHRAFTGRRPAVLYRIRLEEKTGRFERR